MSTTITQARTSTETVSSADVRDVMTFMGTEVTHILRACPQAADDVDLDQILIDISLFALNDIISDIKLRFLLGEEIIREYKWTIDDTGSGIWGPDASNPPIGPVPSGAKIVFTVGHNLRIDSETREAWFRRLKWAPSPQYVYPDGAVHETYGSYSSGAYGITRSVLHDNRYRTESANGIGDYAKE